MNYRDNIDQFVALTAWDCAREIALSEESWYLWILYNSLWYKTLEIDDKSAVYVLCPFGFVDMLIDESSMKGIEVLDKNNIVLVEYFDAFDDPRFVFCFDEAEGELWALDESEVWMVMFAGYGTDRKVTEDVFI